MDTRYFFLLVVIFLLLFSAMMAIGGDNTYQLKNITSGKSSESVVFTGPEPEGWFWEYYPDSAEATDGDLYAVGFFVANGQKHTCGSLSVKARRGHVVELHKNGTCTERYTVK